MIRLTRFRPLLTLAAFVLCISPGSALAAGGGGGGGGGGAGMGAGSGGGYQRPARTPEMLAEKEYNRGLKKRESALKREAKASKASSEKKRDKELKKAAKDWTAAAKYYRAAIKKLPKYHQAHTSLGYALRKLGQYDKSVTSYDLALKIRPGFPEALEYRAEAYLALGRLEDASRSYMRLMSIDREKAGMLMSAMKVWLETPETTGTDGTSISLESVDWFRGWVEEREKRNARTTEVSSAGANW